MLGNQIDPIELTLVIRQVARQPLPRVIPEKTCIEVSHCYRQDQDTHLYLLEHSMDGLTPYSCNTLVIGLALQSALADWWCLHWIPKPADSSIYTGQISLSLVVTDSIPAIAWSDTSVSTIIQRSGAQWQSTGAVENTVISLSLKFQGVAFLHKFISGRVICE